MVRVRKDGSGEGDRGAGRDSGKVRDCEKASEGKGMNAPLLPPNVHGKDSLWDSNFHHGTY